MLAAKNSSVLYEGIKGIPVKSDLPPYHPCACQAVVQAAVGRNGGIDRCAEPDGK